MFPLSFCMRACFSFFHPTLLGSGRARGGPYCDASIQKDHTMDYAWKINSSTDHETVWDGLMTVRKPPQGAPARMRRGRPFLRTIEIPV